MDNPVALPAELAYLLEWFCELATARGSGGSGLNPIGYGEIDAWSRLTRTDVTPAEVALLRAIDAAFLGALSDGRSPGNPNYGG